MTNPNAASDPSQPPAPSAGVSSQLGSRVYDWSSLPVIPTPVGERRDFFDSATLSLRQLECHATTVRVGEASHPAHQHPDEELVFVRSGTLEITINGTVHRAGPGSVIFFASNDLHGMRNGGDVAATYHVLRWTSADTPPVS